MTNQELNEAIRTAQKYSSASISQHSANVSEHLNALRAEQLRRATEKNMEDQFPSLMAVAQAANEVCKGDWSHNDAEWVSTIDVLRECLAKLPNGVLKP